MFSGIVTVRLNIKTLIAFNKVIHFTWGLIWHFGFSRSPHNSHKYEYCRRKCIDTWLSYLYTAFDSDTNRSCQLRHVVYNWNSGRTTSLSARYGEPATLSDLDCQRTSLTLLIMSSFCLLGDKRQNFSFLIGLPAAEFMRLTTKLAAATHPCIRRQLWYAVQHDILLFSQRHGVSSHALRAPYARAAG